MRAHGATQPSRLIIWIAFLVSDPFQFHGILTSRAIVRCLLHVGMHNWQHDDDLQSGSGQWRSTPVGPYRQTRCPSAYRRTSTCQCPIVPWWHALSSLRASALVPSQNSTRIPSPPPEAHRRDRSESRKASSWKFGTEEAIVLYRHLQ
jgi:hypothetical protein